MLDLLGGINRALKHKKLKGYLRVGISLKQLWLNGGSDAVG